jgi:hypothetical protein
MIRHSKLALFILPLILVACGYDDDDDDHGVPPDSCGTGISEARIDVDGAFASVEPGQGAGVYVEYGPEGRWHVFTTCDTAASGYACGWDIYLDAAEGSRIRRFEPDNLEGDDWFSGTGSTSAELVVATGNDVDGLYFETDAGQPLRLGAFLDGYEACQYVYWVTAGAVSKGAPTNPIDLLPETSSASQ